MRLAAIGDLHVRTGEPGPVLPELGRLAADVDAILIAGDITEHGWVTEAEYAAEFFSGLPAPIVAVLGNHDLRALRRSMFRQVLVSAGLHLLDGDSRVVRTHGGATLGLAGISGCGGGFWPAQTPNAISARAWNTLAIRQRREAAKLDAALGSLRADVKIVLMHFAPTPSTLGSEPGRKYWMLGNGELGRVIDQHQVDLVLHGHAHLGNPSGATAAGIPVHNVAYPVRRDVTVFEVRNGIIAPHELSLGALA